MVGEAVVASSFDLVHWERVMLFLVNLVKVTGWNVCDTLVVFWASLWILIMDDGGWKNVLSHGAAIIWDVFFVLVERYHLWQDLLSHLVYRREGKRSDRNMHVGKPAHDRLHLCIIHPVKRLDNHQIILLLGVLEYRCFYWCEMLLVRQVDMVQKRAFSGEECASKLEALRMPKLRLTLFRRRIKWNIFFHLYNEPNLCAVAKISDCKAANFLYKWLAGEF